MVLELVLELVLCACFAARVLHVHLGRQHVVLDRTTPKPPPWSCLTLELSGNFKGTQLRQLQGGCIGVEMAAERSQNYPKHPLGAAQRPPKGILLSLASFGSHFNTNTPPLELSYLCSFEIPKGTQVRQLQGGCFGVFWIGQGPEIT